MLELLLQLFSELARAFFIDALSDCVRGLTGVFGRGKKIRGTAAVFRHVHRRNRDRLLHRLHTERQQDL
jgi:hypothetical protein